MDCKTVQKSIKKYIDKDLKIDDAMDFIDHINSCKDCKEELAIFHMLEFYGNNQEPVTYDFDELVNMEMSSHLKRITSYKKGLVIRLSIWSIANMLVGISAIAFISNLLS